MERGCSVSRRLLLAGAASGLVAGAFPAGPTKAATSVIRFGLTPVFLSNDLELLAQLKSFLARRTGADIVLVQRRTYEEITTLLVSGQLTAAWICGYPFISYRDQLSLVALPVWRGRPLYQSYIIVASDRDASRLEDIEQDTHAFSDPNSNSGYLVTRALLAERRRRPGEFFRKSFFTYGHRNVVRAVASGLAESGSVDGYVWEVIAETEPELAKQTKVLIRSEWLGFPPIACPNRAKDSGEIEALRNALLEMSADAQGAGILRLLRLDGFAVPDQSLFDGIAAKVEQVRSFG